MTVNYGSYGSSLRDLPRLRSTRRCQVTGLYARSGELPLMLLSVRWRRLQALLNGP